MSTYKNSTVAVLSIFLSFFSILLVNFFVPQEANAQVIGAVQIAGEMRKWHKTTLTFDGPNVSETDSNNPFLNYRLNVTFTAPSGKKIIVPGYFAADGNAAETSASSGNKWRVHLAPDEVGEWSYVASFRQGTNVAVDSSATAGTATSFDGSAGSFSIQNTNKTGRDFRGKGMLRYVGEHYLQFAETGEYFVKAGADSPENFLAYEDFDNTPNTNGYLKSWAPHRGDWQNGDPSWQNGKGTEMIGAINYLSGKGANAFSFLTMNINGDDKNVFPYTKTSEVTRIDVSKVAQWEIVFEHADKKGMYLHFKTQETENEMLLDNGNTGTERKLYYRELVARFGHHLALNWNLGEENGTLGSTNQSTAQRQAMSEYFYSIDPYKHHQVIHTPKQPDDLLGSNSKLTGVSIQNGWNYAISSTTQWIQKSANAGRKWVVAIDEQNPANCGIPLDTNAGSSAAGCDYDQNDIRKETLWGNLMHGGAGVEYYFGYKLAESDLTAQNYRSRDRMWDYSKHAITFFNSHIPFWLMTNNNGLTSNSSDYVMAKTGDIYAVYLPNGGTTNITLPSGTYSVKWFDPRNGGALQNGSVTQLNGGGSPSIGNAPNNSTQDWAVIVQDVTYTWDGANPVPTNTVAPTATNTIRPTNTTVPTNTVKPTSSQPTISLAPPTECTANINGDDRVDLTDYSILSSQFLKSNPVPASANIDGKGLVDLTDYSILVSEYGRSCGASVTPTQTQITVEAEDYMNGGPGVGYNDLSAGNSVNNVSDTYRADDVDIKQISGGYAVGHMQTGEWLKYQLSIPAASTYEVVIKVGTSVSTGIVSVEVNGQTVSKAVPNTGAYTTYTDLSLGSIQVPAGSVTMTVTVNNQWFDVDSVILIPR